MCVSVSVRLWVRSRALDGLLLLLADSKLMDLVVVRLGAGRVWLSADLGRGPASVTSPVAINDGQWHHVSVTSIILVLLLFATLVIGTNVWKQE